MRNLKTTLTLLTILFFTSSLLLVSCSKKDDATKTNPFPEENPMPEFLKTTGLGENNYIDKYDINPNGNYSYGYRFKTKVNGKINSLVIKLPLSDGGVEVKVYKFSSKALLIDKSVIVPTNNLEVVVPIPSVNILKDEDYIIIMKTISAFRHARTNSEQVGLPVDIKNIQINGVYTGSTATVLTDLFSNISYYNVSVGYFLGDVSFNFQQTE
jgi:hypothetical protein